MGIPEGHGKKNAGRVRDATEMKSSGLGSRNGEVSMHTAAQTSPGNVSSELYPCMGRWHMWWIRKTCATVHRHRGRCQRQRRCAADLRNVPVHQSRKRRDVGGGTTNGRNTHLVSRPQDVEEDDCGKLLPPTIDAQQRRRHSKCPGSTHRHTTHQRDLGSHCNGRQRPLASGFIYEVPESVVS